MNFVNVHGCQNEMIYIYIIYCIFYATKELVNGGYVFLNDNSEKMSDHKYMDPDVVLTASALPHGNLADFKLKNIKYMYLLMICSVYFK